MFWENREQLRLQILAEAADADSQVTCCPSGKKRRKKSQYNSDESKWWCLGYSSVIHNIPHYIVDLLLMLLYILLSNHFYIYCLILYFIAMSAYLWCHNSIFISRVISILLFNMYSWHGRYINVWRGHPLLPTTQQKATNCTHWPTWCWQKGTSTASFRNWPWEICCCNST